MDPSTGTTDHGAVSPVTTSEGCPAGWTGPVGMDGVVDAEGDGTEAEGSGTGVAASPPDGDVHPESARATTPAAARTAARPLGRVTMAVRSHPHRTKSRRSGRDRVSIRMDRAGRRGISLICYPPGPRGRTGAGQS